MMNENKSEKIYTIFGNNIVHFLFLCWPPTTLEANFLEYEIKIILELDLALDSS